MVSKIIDGKIISQKIKYNVRNEVEKLKNKGIDPSLHILLGGDDDASKTYANSKLKSAEKLGISGMLYIYSNKQELLSKLNELNKNPDVHGIMIEMPLPYEINYLEIVKKINPLKDVEGIHPSNIGRTLIGDEQIVPCTPLAVITILEHENITFEGKDVVIVNHSNVVGKPLAALFLNRNATVTVCHVFTKKTKDYTSKADILVTATGKPKLITSEFVKKDAIIIDVGFAKTEEGICGDVDFESVLEKAAKITPVPGGVGPVTTACVFKNLVVAIKNKR